MSYSEFLARTIKNSGFSLRMIANQCERKYNVKITPSYLSKLQTGAQTPASKDVNVAIAKVCRINPDDLLFEADFERAPENVKLLINQMITFLKNLLIGTKSKANLEDPNINNEINKYINMSTREFVQFLNTYDDFFNSPDPLSFNFGDMEEAQNTELENMFMKFSIGKTMLDSSMFPLIKQGAQLEIIALDEYKSGDIVSVLLDSEKSIVRTYVDAGENVVLIPSNSEFETLTIPKDKIKINGKIKSYTIDL